jgi:hypothetical protein
VTQLLDWYKFRVLNEMALAQSKPFRLLLYLFEEMERT